MKTNFMVCVMILPHFFPKIKEMAIGGPTSSILYNLLPKVIINERGLYSYTTCPSTSMVFLIIHHELQEE